MYKHDRKLVGLVRVQISGSQFANDLAWYSVNHTMLESAGRKFVQDGSQFGLTVSVPKTKGLVMSAVLWEWIKMVNDYTYLGSNLSVDDNLRAELGVTHYVTHYKCNALCNNITFAVTSNITCYMTK